MTYADLTGEVIANLEIDSSDLDRFKVLDSLNSAQLTILNVMPAEHLVNAITTATFNLVANQAAYQWPSDFLRVVSMWLDFSASIDVDNRGVEAVKWNQERFWQTIDTIATSRFPFYDNHVEGGFEIRPKPSANVTDGGRLRYVWRLPEISASQDSLLDDKFKNLLVFRATSLSALVEAYNRELAGDYAKLYQEELSRFMPKEERK